MPYPSFWTFRQNLVHFTTGIFLIFGSSLMSSDGIGWVLMGSDEF